jgi:MFS family permease
MEFIALPIAILTMPMMGSISDYTTTRWGRRKPFILSGSLAAAAAIIGLALAPDFPTLIVAFVLLQLTTNIARGPFAGCVPDLVPEEQVGIASGLMGLMITLGLVGGYLLLMSGYLLGEDFTLPMVTLGLIVAVAGICTFLWIPTGPRGKPREGRTWRRIALETFGTDILRERSYVFLLGSRFFMMMATSFFMNLNILYLERTFGLTGSDQGVWVLVALGVAVGATALGTIPGARLSDRVGRKPVIYASALVGALGMLVIGLAPAVEFAMVGVALVGLGGGAFLAVDWALMTDIIPKASAGRYMGMSNIVEASNGPTATALGGAIMFVVALALGEAIGARAAMLAAVAMFALGATLLTQVHEPRHTPATAPGEGPTSVPRPVAS